MSCLRKGPYKSSEGRPHAATVVQSQQQHHHQLNFKRDWGTNMSPIGKVSITYQLASTARPLERNVAPRVSWDDHLGELGGKTAVEVGVGRALDGSYIIDESDGTWS